MDIGIHYNVPFQAYRDEDAINQGLAKRLHHGTPAHVKYVIDNPLDLISPAVTKGKALHFKNESEEAFKRNVVIWDGASRRGKAWDEFESANKDKLILTKAESADVAGMALSLGTNSLVSKLMQGADKEVTIIWQCPETGLRCKGRLDFWNKKLLTVGDVKTTKNASDFGFPKEIETYGIHYQAAWYCWGLQCLGEKVDYYTIVAVENEPPFLCRVFELDKELIDFATKKNAEAVKKLAYCNNTGDWPGYSQDVQVVKLPEWARKQLENGYV